MYDELIKTIRKQCSDMDCGNCNTCVKLKAADAIEELQKRVPKRPHGRLIDADALIEDLKYDVELDAVTLNSKEIVGNVRREIQDDKYFKQKCIFWIEHTPTAIEEEEGET